MATADSFTSILNGYALAPGSYGTYTTHNNSGNLFAKLSAPLKGAGLLEGSFNYANGQIQDTLAPPRTIGGDYRLTSAGFQPASTQWSGRARWTTVAGSRISNELLATYIGVNEPRTATVDYPAVLVSNVGEPGFASARLIAGADPSSQELALTQRAFVLNDNATYDLGRHVVMAGLATEFMHFDFSSLSSAIGQYQFNNLTAFEAGTTARFIRSIPLRPDGETANFGVTQLGGYVQDRWQATPALTLTLGLRVTVPIFTTTPTVDSALLASPLAVNTGSFIGTSAQWSPRVGFNWSFRPGSALRGGVGLFSGNIPYVWASFAYTQTGNDVVTLNCSGAAAPAFNPDPATQPTSCVTAVTPAVPTVTYFAPGFRQPQSLKFSLGLDHQLPKGFVLSLDGLYDEGYDRMYISDANLTGPVGTLAGEGGRVEYGTIAASSAAGALPAVTPSKVTTAFGPVLQNSNVNGDYAWLVTAQVRRTFAQWLALNVAYTHSEAMDHMSLRDAQTVSNYGFVPVDGTLASRKLATSVFSTPNKVTISGTANLPVGFALSLTYIGRSGLPFTYIVNGDANADGVGNRAGAFDRQQNDAVYVPNGPDRHLGRPGQRDHGAGHRARARPRRPGEARVVHRRQFLPDRRPRRHPSQELLPQPVGQPAESPAGQAVRLRPHPGHQRDVRHLQFPEPAEQQLGTGAGDRQLCQRRHGKRSHAQAPGPGRRQRAESLRGHAPSHQRHQQQPLPLADAARCALFVLTCSAARSCWAPGRRLRPPPSRRHLR